MRVLVTGGCGFIGRPLVRALVSRGDQVRVLDNFSTAKKVNFNVLEEGDILDYRAVKRAVEDVDLVINLASVVGQIRAHENPRLAYDTSVIGVHNLAHATNARIVHFSSSAVYGMRVGPSKESPTSPLDALDYDGHKMGYAYGKWESEVDLLEEGDCLIVRPFNVVGPGQVGSYGMVLPRFIEAARAGRPITVYGDGQQTRSFSYIDTFVETVLKLIDCEAAWQLRQPVFNVGAPTPTTIEELAIEVLRALPPPGMLLMNEHIEHIHYDEVFLGCEDVRERTPDTTLLESLVGPIEWPSIQEIVRRTVEAP